MHPSHFDPKAVCIVLILMLGMAAGSLSAQPAGGQVVAGSATIAGGAGTLTVTQTSARAIINWQDFSLGANDLARFIQPDAASATLNRVVSGLPSSLAGTLQSNGQVYLINPNGVLIGAGARIDTAGFLASTLDVANEEFLAGGDLRFTGASSAAVVNLGAINALGGDVFLFARQLENAGTITAANGTAGLAAGSEVLLTTGSEERIFVHAASAAGAVVNAGVITAATAELKAAGGNAYALAINNTGVVRATGSAVRDGQLWLVASGESTVASAGTLDVSSATGDGGRMVVTAGRVRLDEGARLDATGATGGGKIYVGGGWQGKDAAIANANGVVLQAGAAIDASATQSGDGGEVVLWSDDYTGFFGRITAQGGAQGGDGGRVETSSHGVLQAAGSVDISAAQGRTGSWLLDPWNVTIAHTGVTGTAFADPFNPTAASVILASSVSSALDSGANVTITTGTTGGTGGEINVNAPISWSANSTLTLQAYVDVNVNADITATGDTAGLVITPNNPSNIYGGEFSLNNRARITLSGATPSLTIAGQVYTIINDLGVAGRCGSRAGHADAARSGGDCQPRWPLRTRFGYRRR
jgi:filamentous hemagglutinin family protein